LEPKITCTPSAAECGIAAQVQWWNSGRTVPQSEVNIPDRAPLFSGGIGENSSKGPEYRLVNAEP